MRVNLHGVSVAFGEVWAVRDVSLELVSRQVCALMGPSGSGKSTLLAVISGQLEAISGVVDVEGDTIPHIQWVFQSSPLLDRRTVEDNVALAAIAAGSNPVAAQTRARELLKKFGLSEVARNAAYTLSGGQRQRAATARAIAASPDILLADEPTASLDALSRELVCDALDEAAANGAIVVVATHDEYVAQRCGKIAHIEPALSA
jgi:lipoprotein-releasing system ATP-binding protein